MTEAELKSFSIEKGEKSTVRISGEIPFFYLEKYRKHAIAHVGGHIEIPGFRRGHVPEKMIIERVGEMAILTDMAEHAIEEVYPEIVKTYQLDIVGYPAITITKIAPGNPLGFTATVAVMPEVILPNYKKIATEVNTKKVSKEVTDAEVEKQIEEILRQKIAYERLQEKAKRKAAVEEKQKEMGGATILPTPETISSSPEDEETDSAQLPLPELTDEYVKTLGKPGQFESVADFRTKIRDHLTIEKTQHIDSEHRAKITDAIIEKTTVELPDVMIDAEFNQMFAQMESDLKRAELKLEDYLSHIKKTREDLKKEWAPAAEKRAKLQLVLNEIAKRENIEPDTSMVDHEVSHLMERYKDAKEQSVRIYVESVLKNDAVMKKLESVA